MWDMIQPIYKKIVKLQELNQIPLFIFFSSLFIFISFAGTRIFFSDEGVILDQFYNFIHGSLALKVTKINMTKGVFITVGDQLFGKFSYSLLVLSLPSYYVLNAMDILYSAHLFILQLWALSGGIAVYLAAKTRKLKHAAPGGAVSYLILIAINLYFFKPIYFPMWGEVLSIEFTNILISSFLVLVIYVLFKDLFNTRVAIFASFFAVFATPISFYAITLKHHALAVFLTILAFYLFYKYQEKKDDKYSYYAYALAGLCIWTRILDGVILLASLLITDLFVFRRGIKHILSISLIILISLLPFFGFNYLILGNPFSVIETHPLTDKAVQMLNAKDMITINENPVNTEKQLELLDKLGYSWNIELRTDWMHVLLDLTFLKLGNTFGIFLVSPFLIAALAFALDRINWKIKLSVMDKCFGIYTILFLIMYKNYILSIITDTPIVLEYRYLLIMYVILLYFAFSINKVRSLIECNFKKIFMIYAILVIILIYLIDLSAVPFMNLYYYAALITSVSLIISVSISLLSTNKVIPDTLVIFIISLSLAEASILMLFYYWVVNMVYISPSQNYAVLPILENMLKWMYQVIL